MSKARKRSTTPPGIPVDAVLAKRMQEPEFVRAYEELGPEFEIVRQIIDLRLRRQISQSELAKRVGVKQPSLARLEKRQRTSDLEFVRRIADALDARLEIRLVPRRASNKHSGQGRKRSF